MGNRKSAIFAAGAIALAILIVAVVVRMMPGNAPVPARDYGQPAKSGSQVLASPDPSAARITFDEAVGAVLADQRTFGEGGVVLMGDSIVARSGVYELCGEPVLLAGIPGSRVRDWVDLGPDMFAQVEPSLVVIALGINDTVSALNTDPDKWEADYKALARSARPSRLALVSIMPIDASIPRPTQLSEEMRATLNDRLKNIATATGALVIDPMPSAKGLTLDGVHFNPGGQERWAKNLVAACQAPEQPQAERELAL